MIRIPFYTAAISAALAVASPPAHDAMPITNAGVFSAAVGSSCTKCVDHLNNQGNNSTADWNLLNISCTSGSDCAQCVPTCSAYGGSGVVSWSEAQAYYAANSCAAWHCGGSDPEGGELEVALALPSHERLSALAQALERSEGRVRLNAERHAIQVYGCGDNVFAQYDLSVQQSEALRLALAEKH